MLRERERRQAQPGHPALGPFVQQRHGLVVERDAVRLQQPARLVEREAQVGRADLGQPVGQAQAMQPQPRVLACRQRHTQPRRELAQEVLEQAQRVGGPELMEVVDDQDERLVERAQVGQQARRRRRRRGTPAWRRRARRAAPRRPHRPPHRPPTARSAARPLRRARPRPTRPGRARPSAQDRRRTVFPLPAGAQTSSTPAGPPADSAPNRALRGTSRRAAGERSSVAVCPSNAFILRLPAAGPTLPSEVPHNQGVRPANVIARAPCSGVRAAPSRTGPDASTGPRGSPGGDPGDPVVIGWTSSRRARSPRSPPCRAAAASP